MRDKMTMKEIAKKLNISITTVSRALNNKADVGKETRKAIMELAQEFDYTPNKMAASLRKRKSDVIGLVLPRVEHYFFSTILKGIISSAQKDNFAVVLSESSHVPQKESELIGHLIGMNVSGIILAPCRNEIDTSYLNSMQKNNIPLVLIDRTPKNYQGHFVKLNDFHGAEIAVKHLMQQGYKRIAHIRGHEYSSIAEDRYQGYCHALKLNNIEYSPALVKTCEFVNKEEGYYFTKELLLSDDKPDAIFVVTDEVALGVYKALAELGLNIPVDVGVMGYSNSMISNYITPRLSTIDQPGFRMGETAYEFLRSAMNDGNKIRQKVFEAKLLIRESSVRKLA
jgi:LacI family transcriptional regulator